MKITNLWLLLVLLLIPAYSFAECPTYDRKAWEHWTDEDKDCQNARHEVLTEESLDGWVQDLKELSSDLRKLE